jgi:hypothetical protein
MSRYIISEIQSVFGYLSKIEVQNCFNDRRSVANSPAPCEPLFIAFSQDYGPFVNGQVQCG